MSALHTQSRIELDTTHPTAMRTLPPHNVGSERNGLISTEQLATFFNVHERTARRWTSRGQVPYYKIGKSVRFCLPDVLKVAEQSRG